MIYLTLFKRDIGTNLLEFNYSLSSNLKFFVGRFFTFCSKIFFRKYTKLFLIGYNLGVDLHLLLLQRCQVCSEFSSLGAGFI